MTYVVVRCPQCRGLVLGNTAYKTRSCTQCGHRIVLRGMKFLARTDSSQDAIQMIQELKKRDVKGELP